MDRDLNKFVRVNNENGSLNEDIFGKEEKTSKRTRQIVKEVHHNSYNMRYLQTIRPKPLSSRVATP